MALASTSELGHQAAGRQVRAWSRPKARAENDQPALGDGAAPGLPRQAQAQTQAQGGSGAGSRGRWRPLCSPTGCGRWRRPAGPASKEPGAAVPFVLRSGAQVRGSGQVGEAAEQALSTDLGLATGGSEPSLAFHFLRGDFLSFQDWEGNRTGVWRGQKTVGAG